MSSSARPPATVTWKRARRRARDRSHQYSTTGQGPVQPSTASRRPRTATVAGRADTPARPSTVTGRPSASSTVAGTGVRCTTDGQTSRSRPGQGASAGAAGS